MNIMNQVKERNYLLHKHVYARRRIYIYVFDTAFLFSQESGRYLLYGDFHLERHWEYKHPFFYTSGCNGRTIQATLQSTFVEMPRTKWDCGRIRCHNNETLPDDFTIRREPEQ
jgi:hypothetical protein